MLMPVTIVNSGLVPASVRELMHHGHEVLIETRAGAGIGFDDKAYESAGAKVLETADQPFCAKVWLELRSLET